MVGEEGFNSSKHSHIEDREEKIANFNSSKKYLILRIEVCFLLPPFNGAAIVTIEGRE